MSCCSNASERFIESVCTITMFLTMESRIVSGRSSSARKTPATESSACSGHGTNQSMTELFTMPGNERQRTRSVSPTGDIARITCRLSRHLPTK